MDELNKLLNEAKSLMEKAVKHTQDELGKIRAGRVMPNILDDIMVDYYGTPTQLSQVGNVSNLDARTLIIKPWEKKMLAEIEKAIKLSNLGVNPQNDGEVVRLNFPALTEERRKELVKKAKTECEQGKVSVRNIRKEVNENVKKLQKKGVPEDDIKKAETKVQDFTDTFVKKIDEILAAKEKEIMTV
ncbi:MAG: ribosome recycling factor [Flammeovirgaceae bacterium]